jgi:hypothetical protein
MTNEDEISKLLEANKNWIDKDTGKPMIELEWDDGHKEIEELAKVVYCLAYVEGEEGLSEDSKVTQSCGDVLCINPDHLVLVS